MRIDLGLGKASARALGCDLTFDYVKINAEYYCGPSANVDPATRKRAPGGVNRPVIVEALSYIRKFAGKRAVIKYGGAAMIDPALKRSFAEEMVLLQSAGLRPVIVHGGGPEITKTLEKMGRKSEFADGQRITGAEEVRVVEMVLTGRINTEIVGLINSLGGNAIGLSGKDGRLLIASKLEPAPGKTDLGFVGEIDAVNADLLDMFLERGYMPVISPVGFGLDGASYNINADVAAGEIAVGLRRRAADLPDRRGRHPRRRREPHLARSRRPISRRSSARASRGACTSRRRRSCMRWPAACGPCTSSTGARPTAWWRSSSPTAASGRW